MTDLWFRCAVDWMSRRMAAQGDQVWRYEFGFGSPGSDKPPEHTSEMAYVYHSAPADAAFGRWPPVQRYWVNFVRTGNPNGPGLPHWPQMGRSDAYLGFDPEGIALGYGLRRAICALPDHDVDHPRSPALR